MTTALRGRRRRLLAVPAVLAAWFAIVGLVTLLAEPTRNVIVVAPQATALRAASASGADLLDVRRGFSIMHSDRPGFVRALYAGGAWLVWPALAGGCLLPSDGAPAG
jgi:hypothetical protein